MGLQRIRQIRFALKALTEELVEELDRQAAMIDAITLAFEERTGEPAPSEFTYTEADLVRAREILRLFPKKSA